MGREIWDFVYDNHHKLGYRTHSLMVEACVIEAMRNKFHKEVSEDQLEHLKAYEKVGKQAEDVKPLVFMGRASKTYKQAEQEYKENVKLGIMTEEEMDKSLKRLRKKLRTSIHTTLKDQEKREAEERAKRKKLFLKKRGCKV